MMNEKLLPASWRMVSIGDVCSHPQYGYTTKASREGNLKLLRTTDITSGKIDWKSVPFCSTNPDELSKYLLSEGDIVVSRAGSIGVSYLIERPDESVFASYLIRFKPYINKKYFYYFLNSPFYWHEISENKSGIAVQNVNAQKLRAIPFPVAPEDEQHRIVAKIEELFSEIDQGVKSLQKAKAQLQVYRQALLKHAFEGKLTAQWRSQHPDKVVPAEQLLEQIKQAREERYQQQLDYWKVAIEKWEFGGKEGKKPSKPRKAKINPEPANLLDSSQPLLPEGWFWLHLGSSNIHVSDGPFGSNLKTKDYVDSGVRVVRLENIGHGVFIKEKESYITPEKYEQIKKHSLLPGDLVFSSFITDLIRIAEIPNEVEISVNKADCFQIRLFGETLNRQYLLNSLQMHSVYKQLEKFVHGIGRPRINTTQLKGILIPICSPEEQCELVKRLNSATSYINETERSLEAELKKADTLRRSILKKAFSGQLVPQDPNDEPASQLLDRIKAEKIEQQSRAKAAKKRRQVSKKSPSVPL